MADRDEIPFERLLDLAEGRLSAAEAAAVTSALAAARPATRQRASWASSFMALRGKVALADPPPDLHNSLLAQFQRRAPGGFLRRVRAMLTFDSALAPAPAGLRSMGARPRQLIFACDLVEIALNVRPGRQSDRLDVDGQVFPRQLPSAAGLVARLTMPERLIDISLTSDLGEFSFAAIPPGPYKLELFIEDSQVELDTFEVTLIA